MHASLTCILVCSTGDCKFVSYCPAGGEFCTGGHVNMCARYSECPGSDQHSNPGAQTSRLAVHVHTHWPRRAVCVHKTACVLRPLVQLLTKRRLAGAPHSSYTTYDVAGGGGGGGNSGGTDAFAVDGETCGG